MTSARRVGVRTPRCRTIPAGTEVGPGQARPPGAGWDEDEGDRTRDDWPRGHRGYVSRQATREGSDFHDRIETVLERFTVLWPRGFQSKMEITAARR
jgi:hypothetical protein